MVMIIICNTRRGKISRCDWCHLMSAASSQCKQRHQKGHRTVSAPNMNQHRLQLMQPVPPEGPRLRPPQNGPKTIRNWVLIRGRECPLTWFWGQYVNALSAWGWALLYVVKSLVRNWALMPGDRIPVTCFWKLSFATRNCTFSLGSSEVLRMFAPGFRQHVNYRVPVPQRVTSLKKLKIDERAHRVVSTKVRTSVLTKFGAREWLWHKRW